MQLEKDVEGYLRRQVEKRGGRCYKFIPDTDNGMPDRIILLPGGVLVWVETKNGDSEKARLLQRVQHRNLRELGQRVEIVHTKAQVDALMREI
jgi:hypothetical protein